MKSLNLGRWNIIFDNRYNPIHRLDTSSRRHFARVLAWLWSTVFTLSVFVIFQLQTPWLVSLFIIAGAFTTISLFNNAQSRHTPKAPAQNLSRASVCVWQLDREA